MVPFLSIVIKGAGCGCEANCGYFSPPGTRVIFFIYPRVGWYHYVL